MSLSTIQCCISVNAVDALIIFNTVSRFLYLLYESFYNLGYISCPLMIIIFFLTVFFTKIIFYYLKLPRCPLNYRFFVSVFLCHWVLSSK